MTDGPGREEGPAGALPGAPWPWREHQAAALEALAAAREQGRERVWVSLPPGAGKTAVGLAHALASGRPVLVLVPNTAVRSVWLGEAARFAATGRRRATTDAALPTDLTVLTYQVLVGRGEDEDAPARLSPAGERVLAEMTRRGPFTIVLDECHHLLALWGELLAHVLDRAGRTEVIGLTATPPSRMSRAEAEQMRAVIGEPVAQVAVPPLVARGELAPFVELVWLTRPTEAETDWLAGRATRTAEFIAWLTDPAIASTGLLAWAEQRWGVLSRDWSTTSRTDPVLADAVLRLAHAGHLSMPPQAVLGEATRAAPGLEDWLAIAQDWWAHCLRRSDEPRDAATIERLRALLPGLDHRLGRHGITPGVPAVQRVLARSDAKARGAVEIVAATLAADPQARLLVLCDHAEAAALPADAAGAISEQSGSARRVAALLAADPRVSTANPLLVTGGLVAGPAGAAARLIETAAGLGGGDGLGTERLDDGLLRVTGWGPPAWVRSATAMIESGACNVLVGTRALLGEGWDAPSITGVVDLGSATTGTAVVQTRGRALRRDPGRPDKVAVNWSVCAVAPDHLQGDGDWRRLVRKHDGWFAPDETGEIVDQVAHLDSRFSPYAPPPAELFDAANAAALVRAEHPGRIRRAWAGVDPDGFPRSELRITPAAGRRDRGPVLTVAPDDRLAWDGHGLVVPGRERSRPGRAGAACAVALAVGGLLCFLAGATPLALAASGAAAALAGRRAWSLGRRARREPGLVDYAQTVLAALRGAGLVDAPAALATEVAPDGELRFSLSDAGPGQAEVFVQALAEVIGPVGADARYLINRWRLGPGLCGPLAVRGLTGSLAENWHAVPTVLADSRAHADLFAAAWGEHVGGGAAVHTGRAIGAGLLAAVRGTSPLGEDSALAWVRRTRW